MITVIVTSRASALKRELVDLHFSPCSTLPTLPTTSTETWLFLKVFFWCFKMWISLSQEWWNEISFQHQIVWPQQNFYYLTAGEKESLIIVSLLPFREVSLRWNQDFFWTQKKLTSLCFAKDSKEIDCFQDFWSSQNPGQLNPRLWNYSWTFCGHKRDASFELCS